LEALLSPAAIWLDAVGVGPWARGSGSVYPVANVLHVLGTVMLVGAIGVLDLRLAGAWRQLPAAPLSAALTPLAIAGLAVMLASGIVLFAADGEALARSRIFHWKLALVALALVNAALFRWRWDDGRRWEYGAPPATGRAMAIASVALWVAVLISGRMIAYR
jgi:hypothetical protein